MDSEISITIASQDDLAFFLDTNCNALLDNRSLMKSLETANYTPELAPVVNYELAGLGFWFDGCTAKREISATTITGEEMGSPLPSELKSTALEYFILRFEQTTNLYLKTRYGLVLWNTSKPYKHIKYIQGALDGSLDALAKANCTDSGLNNCLELLWLSSAIATTIPHRKADVITAIRDRFTGSIPFEREGRNQLLHVITEQAKLFRPDATKVLIAARELYEENYKAENFLGCQHIAELAAPFAQGSNADVREWHYRRGQAYEGTAKRRLSDDSSLIAIKFYTQAAQAFQLAGNEEAEQRALQQAQDLKDKLRLGKVSAKLPDDLAQKLSLPLRQPSTNKFKR